MSTPARTEIGLTAALLPLAVLFGCFVASGFTIGLGTPVLIVSMLLAATVAGLLARRHGAGWDDLQRSAGEKIAAVLPVILILLAIGLLIGTWVLSGTIPLLVSLGIQLIRPDMFVLTTFLLTAVMSICTGTSWGSAGTLGVALMGAAAALEVPLAMSAGAVVSGAYFGDKMSPLSDSTNICALGAGADLYRHIRHMLYTAVPSFALSLVVFALAGGSRVAGAGVVPEGANRMLREIEVAFNVGFWAVLPVVVVLVGVTLKKPPALVLAASAVLAMGVGLSAQGFSLAEGVAAAVSGFDVSMVAARLDGEPSGLFRRLVGRGGLFSMATTLIVVISAFLFAAGLDVSGALDRVLRALLSGVRSVFGLIAATMVAGATMVSLTSHGGVTALIVGGMFQRAYEDRRLAPENLSRSLEDSVTIIDPLLPWTVSGIFMATTLGVPTLEYLPWAIFCLGGPVFSLIYALLYSRTGVGIRELAPLR